MPVSLPSGQQLVLKAPPLSDIAGSPKFNMRNIWKLPPTMLLNLFDAQSMRMRHDLKTQKRSISMPFTVKLCHVDPAADRLQSLRCTVEARWCRRRSFATTKLNNRNSSSEQIDQVFRSARQTRVVYLPPIWPIEAPNDADQAHTYAATTDIVIFVPDCVANPTIDCGLLSRTYSLELSFRFEASQSLPRYTISRTIPVKVQVHNLDTKTPAESLSSGLNDFDTIESDTAPPPSYGDQARSSAILAAF